MLFNIDRVLKTLQHNESQDSMSDPDLSLTQNVNSNSKSQVETAVKFNWNSLQEERRNFKDLEYIQSLVDQGGKLHLKIYQILNRERA